MAAGVNNLKPFRLNEVKPKQTWRPGVNNLNPFRPDDQTNMADVRTILNLT